MRRINMFLFILLSIVIIFAVSCSKKQTVKPQAEQEPVSEMDVSEEVPAIEEEPVAEEPPARPEMRELEDVFFDFDKYILKSEAKADLNRNAEQLREYPSASIIIEGHCDERGTEDYNMALGEKRAKSVKAYLISLGIDGTRLSVISYGETRPFASGHDESAWSQNRRAHFVAKK